MPLLFDENTPFSLARELVDHECSHVIRLDWRGTQNGALLTRAERAGFEVLITLDDDMKPEQNMSNGTISVLVLKPRKQGKKTINAMSGRVLTALKGIRPGEILLVEQIEE